MRLRKQLESECDTSKDFDPLGNVFAMKRKLMIFDYQGVTLQAKLSLIQSIIPSETGVRHQFKSRSSAMPTSCDFCLLPLWGPREFCSVCKFTCHARCEMKVPSECRAQFQRKETPSKLNRESVKKVPLGNDNDKLSDTMEDTHKSGYAAIVLYDHDALPSESSGTGEEEEEISVFTGDRVYVLEEHYGKGWSLVNKGEIKGLVPRSFLSDREMRKAEMLFEYQNDKEQVSVAAGMEVDVLRDEGNGWVIIYTINGGIDFIPSAFIKF